MEEKQLKLYAPNLVAVGVDRRENSDFSGRIWDQYHDKPQSFANAIEMVQKIDAFLDELDFPQRATIPRSFRSKVPVFAGRTAKRGRRGIIVDSFDQDRGEQGTFIVQVKYRQNSTWQGQVIWAEENKKVYFRSALELLKLIDSALSSKTPEAFSGDNASPADEEDSTPEA